MVKKTNREATLRRERRMVRVPIDIEFLALSLLRTHQNRRLCIADDVPSDAIFVTAYYSPECSDAFIVYAHELFDSVEPGVQLPVKGSYIKKVEPPDEY